MKFNFSSDEVKLTKMNRVRWVATALLLSLVVYLGTHPSLLLAGVRAFLTLFFPLWLGIGLAFVLDIPTSYFEKRWFSADAHPRHRRFFRRHARGVAVSTTLGLFLLGLGVCAFAVLPQLMDTLATLVENLPTYLRNTQAWLLLKLESLPFGNEVSQRWLTQFGAMDVTATVEWLLGLTDLWWDSVVTMTVNVTSKTIATFVGLVLMVYLLASKPAVLLGGKRVLFALCTKCRAVATLQVLQKARDCFYGFVAGQCVEAVILGGLCLVGMAILRLPYALLISLVVTVCAIIPFVGGLLSAVIGSVLLLLVNPSAALVFLIFLIVLQQVEGNVIYPRVVGSSIGLPAFWVLLSVYVGASVGGFLGILLGVPTCSLLYALAKEWVAKQLQRNNVDEQALQDGRWAHPDAPIVTKLEQSD